ncbi:MAG TPA: leucyl aminopeptidase [Solirubrobacteraceae bacterium]|nr:leucyl aminopeptidase [Solirubrobacteraceae bacterium]
MRARATTQLPVETAADTVVVGLLEGEGIAHDLPGGELTALVTAGEAAAKLRRLAHTHAAGKRWILVGLGAREELDGETARVAAALALGRAREVRCETLCWEVPHEVGDEIAGALVEGTLLAAHRDERFRSAGGRRDDEEPPGPSNLVVSAHHDVGEAVRRAATVIDSVNWARELQDAPANVLTPSALAEAARSIEGVTVEVDDRDGLEARGMGCFAAVAQGSAQTPTLITLRHEPAGVGGALLALVGKAVTFDTGGISIKPASKMADMKYDMSGGAAVLGAMRAIAALGLPVRVLGVVGATENMPSDRALRPGDVLTAMDGTTVEVLNTDAEGRLVLADCLAHAVAQGAERIVDLATLTGAIVTALGDTHCGLMAGDDAWAASVEAAGRTTGELAWRLPLHPEYGELLRSRVADVANLNEQRKAASIVAAMFLQRFTGDVPWAHLDIVGPAWDLGRPYAAKGGSGFGVRLLVELAGALGADG